MQKVLGHSTIAMTAHYTHGDTDSARRVLAPLAEILSVPFTKRAVVTASGRALVFKTAAHSGIQMEDGAIHGSPRIQPSTLVNVRSAGVRPGENQVRNSPAASVSRIHRATE